MKPLLRLLFSVGQLATVTVLSRLVLAAAYIGVSCFVISQVLSESYLPTATRDLPAGHELVAGDLETREIKKLLAHYLQNEVKQGKSVTSDMVTPKSLPPELAPTIAAVVTMKQQVLKQRGIVQGSTVEIRLAPPAGKLQGKVAKLICDELTCSVIVGLTKTPPLTIAPSDFSNADVHLDTTPTSTPPPVTQP